MRPINNNNIHFHRAIRSGRKIRNERLRNNDVDDDTDERTLLTIGYTDKCSAVAEMGDRLATTDMGQKVGAVPLFTGEAGSPSNTMSPGPRPT